MIKVIIVDDKKVFRETMRFILNQDEEINVIGIAKDGVEARELCISLKPDVVLMDIMMPECNGIEATRRIKETKVSPKIIMLTTFNDNKNVSEALNNGADGYVLKDIDGKDLIYAIKSTYRGMGTIHHTVMDSFVKKSVLDLTEEESVNERKNYDLTDRDIKIIGMIVDGKNNKEISEATYFSEGSIRNLVSEILNKLKLKDRTQLAVFALKNKIV